MLDCFLKEPALLPSGIYGFPHGYDGVTSQFLEDAETYDAKSANFAHCRRLLEFALARSPHLPDRPFILDVGCGAGNTVLPLLELFPHSRLVATDISPNLLAILRRRLEVKGELERCAVVSMDLLAEDWLRPRCADLIIGGAILHHLLDPGLLLRRVCCWLRPGGFAVFFEPFAIGTAMLTSAYLRLVAERESLGLDPAVVDALQRIIFDTQTRLKADPQVMPHLDDKWLFTRASLAEAVRGVGAVQVFPMDTSGQFEQRTVTVLRRIVANAVLPQPALAILREFDAMFDRVGEECIAAGCVIVTPTE